MKQRSPFHPRSVICLSASATPARIFSALIPGGKAGLEKSTFPVVANQQNSRLRSPDFEISSLLRQISDQNTSCCSDNTHELNSCAIVTIFDVTWGPIPAHLRRIISLPAGGVHNDGERYEQSQIQSRSDGELHIQIYCNRQCECHL